jgi:pentose-5-phosphate-3-epimerase
MTAGFCWHPQTSIQSVAHLISHVLFIHLMLVHFAATFGS